MYSFVSEEELICEALVREIGRAQRWSGVVSAWQALLAVRAMAQSIRDDAVKQSGGQAKLDENSKTS